MKSAEIRNLSIDEIDQKVNALKKDLLNLRIQAKNQKLEQFSRLKTTKKDIARLLTVKTEIKKLDKK
ncbi:MAG: 50S ribosomal protein L29 [Candidatus Omnitrophica bacterium]|nr:50S ribosomal protein L29 [Candidatus Omnitrophota bacterium]